MNWQDMHPRQRDAWVSETLGLPELKHLDQNPQCQWERGYIRDMVNSWYFEDVWPLHFTTNARYDTGVLDCITPDLLDRFGEAVMAIRAARGEPNWMYRAGEYSEALFHIRKST